MKITLPKDTMLEILETEDLILVNELYDTRRWSLTYDLVFKHESKIYRTSYNVGATECQDEGPWEFVKEVECQEVEAYENTVIEYRAVK